MSGDQWSSHSHEIRALTRRRRETVRSGCFVEFRIAASAGACTQVGHFVWPSEMYPQSLATTAGGVEMGGLQARVKCRRASNPLDFGDLWVLKLEQSLLERF